MTRGRKPTQAAAEVLSGETLDHAAPIIRTDLAALDQVAQDTEARAASTVALAQQLQYEGSLDPDVIEQGIADSMRRLTREIFETGRRLLLLKERCGHGNFLERLDRLGIATRGAQKLMAVALKFSNAPTLAHLEHSKLLELAVLDDNEVQQLVEDGSVRDVSLDAIDRMSVRELRAALRESKADTEAARKVAADKTAAIDNLSFELERTRRLVEKRSPDSHAEALRLAAVGASIAAENAIANDLAPTIEALLSADPGARDVVDGLLASIETRVREIRETHGLNAADVAQWAGEGGDSHQPPAWATDLVDDPARRSVGN